MARWVEKREEAMRGGNGGEGGEGRWVGFIPIDAVCLLTI